VWDSYPAFGKRIQSQVLTNFIKVCESEEAAWRMVDMSGYYDAKVSKIRDTAAWFEKLANRGMRTPEGYRSPEEKAATKEQNLEIDITQPELEFNAPSDLVAAIKGLSPTTQQHLIQAHERIDHVKNGVRIIMQNEVNSRMIQQFHEEELRTAFSTFGQVEYAVLKNPK
jgi:hypothetical protein